MSHRLETNSKKNSNWKVSVMKENDAIKQKYWNNLKNVTLILIVLWFVPTFSISFFANELTFDFFGWPFSFWMAAQGSQLIYLLIVWIYALFVNKLDKTYLNELQSPERK